MNDALDVADAVKLARWFAALSGPFDPKDALKASGPDSSRAEAAIAVASHLATACDTHAGADGTKWLMRGTERRWDIDALQKSGQLADALAWRGRQEPFDEAAQDVAAALLGAGAFGPNELETTLAAPIDQPERAQLQRLAYALEWAGPAAPGYARLAHLRSMLNRLDDKARSAAILARGFQGREDQRKILSDWIAGASARAPVQALSVTGLPGVGKSALLEMAVTEAAGHPLLVLRLDFDRSVLDVLDQVGLTVEAARQITGQLPDDAGAMREMRLKASGLRRENLKGRGRDMIPGDLAAELGRVVKASGRTVVVVLDTWEALRGRGETHPSRLFEWLDKLVGFGVAPMAVVAAGRGDAFDSVADRIGARLVLSGLMPDAADRVLDKVGVPSDMRANIHAFAKGDPLLLTLAGAAVTQPGAKPLAQPRSRARSKADTDDIAAAQLFRFLLSQIADRDLRKLVDPGLLVRRINFEVIRDVLAPELGLNRIGDKRAKDLMDELEKQTWLVERDPAAKGWLRQNPGMRAQLTPLFYASNPARCAKIDRAAAEWFANCGEPSLKVEALYHRLQLMRRGGAAPPIDRDVAMRFDNATLSELPDRARDHVLQARGERSTIARAGHAGRRDPAGTVDPRAVKDLQLVIERGDWSEAADLYARAIEPARIEPASEAAHAVRTFLWRVGRWRQAKNSLRDLDAIRPPDDDLSALRPEDAMALLEMRAEFSFGRLVKRLVADDAWRNLVHDVATRGAKTDLSAGAIGFALRTQDIPIERSWRRVDPVRAADELWSAGGSGDALAKALSVAQERMAHRAPLTVDPTATPGSVTDPEARATTLAARRLAVLSPYASPLSLSAQFGRGGRPESHARSALNALAGAAAWWNGGIARSELAPAHEPQDPIEMLADLGLVAEWAGAAAFILRDGDLALIAKSAETWRRVMAGQWAYGEAPRDWIGARRAEGLDASLWMRVHELFGADEPVALSRAMLAAWAGGAGRLPDRLRARLVTLAARAGTDAARREGPDGAVAAAGALLRTGAPAAFVPALATLVALKHRP